MKLKDFIIEKSEKALKEMNELSKINNVSVEVIVKTATVKGMLTVLNDVMSFMMENNVDC